MFLIQDFGVNGQFPSSVGGTGTAIKYFGRNAAFAAGATWTNPATPSSTNANGALIVPADNKLNGQLIEVVASGAFLPSSAITSSETVKVELYAVTGSFASPTYTLLADINGGFAPGVDGIWYNFAFDVCLQGNNDSGIVGGFYTSVVNNTVERNNVALQNSLTGIVFGSSSSASNQTPGALGGPFGLVVGVTFSQSDAGNKAKLYEFSISA
ncbi:MAG TPA: hypothetical protein VN843_13935 [Anaerolineales bacterium]|nr:hypothetical protein [Anaerolineales bacterium]